jgi:hypothetical protein
MSRVQNLPLHPFLLSSYAVVALLAFNIGQVEPVSAVRFLVVSLIITGLMLFLVNLLVKDWRKSAVFTFFLLALFFAYGHVYEAVKGAEIYGINIGRHRLLMPLWGALFVLGIIWVRRKKDTPILLTQALNVFALVALVFPLIQIVDYKLKAPVSIQEEGENTLVHKLQIVDGENLRVEEGMRPPDIYYIILDMYVRQDILAEVFNYDNAAFLDSLRDLGFYVAGCSQSNYTDTPLSLATTLNVNYLEDFAGEFIEQGLDHYSITPYVEQNVVRHVLENLGYTIVNIESGFFLTEWKDADVYLSSESEPDFRDFAFGGLNNFESMFLQNSMLMLLNERRSLLPLPLIPFLDQPYMERRQQILYSLDRLETITEIEGPKFVFAHIVAPHPPFVFGPDGEFVPRNTPLTLNDDVEDRDWNRYVPGYTGQVTFLNGKMLVALREILQKSEVPPIIIIQGDHGVTRLESEKARLAILNAYHFGGGDHQSLYSTISPVNTFRVVLNTYFQGDFELLEDLSFLPERGQGPYDFEVIRSSTSGCEDS